MTALDLLLICLFLGGAVIGTGIALALGQDSRSAPPPLARVAIALSVWVFLLYPFVVIATIALA